MMYLWPYVVVFVVCTSLRGAESCTSKCMVQEIYFHSLHHSDAEDKDVRAIAAVLEEVEDWEALAHWLKIRVATINDINKNCASFQHAQCKWNGLVRVSCDRNAGDPLKTVAYIADVLSKMDKKKQGRSLKNLPFTSEFCDVVQSFISRDSRSYHTVRQYCVYRDCYGLSPLKTIYYKDFVNFHFQFHFQ